MLMQAGSYMTGSHPNSGIIPKVATVAGFVLALFLAYSMKEEEKEPPVPPPMLNGRMKPLTGSGDIELSRAGGAWFSSISPLNLERPSAQLRAPPPRP